MIREIYISLLLNPVFKLADKVPDTTPENFKTVVLERMAEKTSVMVVEEKNNEIRGFLFCTVDRYGAGSAFVIQYAYVKPDAFEVGSELMARAISLAKHDGYKEIYMMTSRKPEAFARKYKFEVSKYVLKRSIE